MKILYLSTICTFLAIQSQAQFAGIFDRQVVKYMPTAYEKPMIEPQAKSQKNSELPWIVYADGVDHYTSSKPGGSLYMKKLNFMEPFYVADEENGYFKLVKYPGALKRKKLLDKKTAVSYGWIAKSKLLLSQRAYVNKENGYAQKSISIINNINPLLDPKLYFDNTDSAWVYNSPELTAKKGKIRLNEIVYVYKKAEDGKSYLVGSEEQFTAESALKIMYGWVSSDIIQSWGSRLYLTSANPNDTDLDEYATIALNKAIGSDNKNLIDPLVPVKNMALRSFPVLSNSKEKLELGLSNDLFNKDNSQVISINGNVLTYQDYLKLRKNRNKINVVFVIDGGSPMTKYFSGLTNTVQSFESIFNDFGKSSNINYSSVLYRSNMGCQTAGIINTDWSKDYKKLINFLILQSKVTDKCNSAINEQPVFDGISKAVSLLSNKQDQTNLIVLLGSTGDVKGINGEAISQVSEELGKVDARLLALQVYSDFDPSFNNFVIGARKLVMQTATKTANRRKSNSVNGEGLKASQNYNTNLEDSISYYLDFPKNSLIQGGVVFPTKGSVSSNISINTAMRRFINETKYDINTHLSALDSAFRLTGISRLNLTPIVESTLTQKINEYAADGMPHNGFKFFTTSNFEANQIEENKASIQYAIVINRLEYNSLMELFSLMQGNNLQIDASNFRKKLVKNYIHISKDLLDQAYSKGAIKKMNLAEYIKLVSGLPLNNPFLNEYMVKDLKNKSNMPQEQFEAYINMLKYAHQQIRKSTQLDQQFISNGNIYYYITENNFNSAFISNLK